MDKLKNIHPGEILLEEFLLPMEISQTRLANSIGVPPRRINEIVLGKRGITADTALAPCQSVWHLRAILDGLAGRIRTARGAQRDRGSTGTDDADCGVGLDGSMESNPTNFTIALWLVIACQFLLAAGFQVDSKARITRFLLAAYGTDKNGVDFNM